MTTGFSTAAMLFDCLLLQRDDISGSRERWEEAVTDVIRFFTRAEQFNWALSHIVELLYSEEEFRAGDLEDVITRLRTICYLMAVKPEEKHAYHRDLCLKFARHPQTDVVARMMGL